MANANLQYTNLRRQYFLGQFVNVCLVLLILLGFAAEMLWKRYIVVSGFGT
ncbi:MAG: hypothetical protein ABFQ95_06760 [Pseudomonadota bacterium]